MLKSAIFAAALVCVASSAEARPTACVQTGDVMRPCAYEADFLAGVKEIRVKMHRVRVAESGATVAHPSGCPRRAFCGCGAAVRVFGSPVRSLWLAANWFRFPRTAPAAGMVAVRRHHVMVLEANLGAGIWRVFDANSGHHQTRVHARSIAGFAIVNPHS